MKSGANAETSAAALQTLERGPLCDLAISAFASQVGSVDREAGLAWSLEITDPGKRRSTTMIQTRRWLNADHETATRWIEAHETLPAEWKAELLKR